MTQTIETNKPILYHQPVPGPYAYTFTRDGCDDVLSIDSTVGERERVADIRFWNEFDPTENGRREATAKLLAASPELRDGLTRLVNAVRSVAGNRILDDELQKALASAELIVNHLRMPSVVDESEFLIPTILPKETAA